MGWNVVTAAGYLRVLVKCGLLSCTVEGGLGENVKKIYRLTPKGLKVLEHVREIQKLCNGRLGNK
jgi:DNA-binding PadR family transcriptional regulator